MSVQRVEVGTGGTEQGERHGTDRGEPHGAQRSGSAARGVELAASRRLAGAPCAADPRPESSCRVVYWKGQKLATTAKRFDLHAMPRTTAPHS